MRGGYLRRSLRDSCHTHKALPARFREQNVRTRASVRSSHSSLNAGYGCGVRIGDGHGSSPAYAPRDISVSSSWIRRRDDSLTILSWRMRCWRRLFSSPSSSGAIIQEGCIGASIEKGERIITAALEGRVEFCRPRPSEQAYCSGKLEVSAGDVSGVAYMSIPAYWESDTKALDEPCEFTSPRHSMLGSFGAAMKAPEIAVEVREGVHEASPDGGVADARGWAPIWVSSIASDRRNIDRE